MRERQKLRVILGAVCLLAVALLASLAVPAAPKGPYFATGIKICEVDTTSAIIWTRLTRNAAREGKDKPLPVVRYKDPKTGGLVDRRGRQDLEPVVEFPNGSTIDTIEGAVPGAPGDVQGSLQNRRRSLMADDGVEGRRSHARFHRAFSH